MWWVVAAPLVVLLFFPLLVLLRDRMRKDVQAPKPPVRRRRPDPSAPVVRKRPGPLATVATTAPRVPARAVEPPPDVSKLERARLAWAAAVEHTDDAAGDRADQH